MPRILLTLSPFSHRMFIRLDLAYYIARILE
jgi:hypothetical protein